MNDLLERLRAVDISWNQVGEDCAAAADEIERLNAENARLRETLASSKSWIDRWTKHVGNCSGSDETCTCGRAAILFEASAVLAEQGEK